VGESVTGPRIGRHAIRMVALTRDPH